MITVLQIANAGPVITSSNYWKTEHATRGLFYLSTNAGAFRLLVPASQREAIVDMRRGVRHVVVSMLPANQWEDGQFAAEWLVEDGTDNPWSCHLSPGQIDRAFSPDDCGKQWVATVWDEKNGAPHKCIERPAFAQIVPALPWLKRISE